MAQTASSGRETKSLLENDDLNLDLTKKLKPCGEEMELGSNTKGSGYPAGAGSIKNNNKKVEKNE